MKQFKDDRVSVRDDKRYRKGKDVRTLELAENCRTFLDEERRFFTRTISIEFRVVLATVHN